MYLIAWILLTTLLGWFNSVCATGQMCLKASRNSEPHIPPFNDIGRDGDSLPASKAVQAIITTYRFTCDCVKITTWETYLQPGGKDHNMGNYDITFQLWRPSQTNDGCYSLVGENAFTSVTLDPGRLANLPSSSILIARAGDVVGYYTYSRDDDDQGIQLDRNNEYSQNIIYFIKISESESLPVSNSVCPSESSNWKSTMAAPMLQINTIDHFPCAASSSPLLQSSISIYASPVITTSVFNERQDASTSKFVSSAVLYSILPPIQVTTRPSTNTDNVKIALVIGIVVLVLIVLVSIAGGVLVTVILRRRRKLTSKKKSVDNGMDLSNPNYETSSSEVVPKIARRPSKKAEPIKFVVKSVSKKNGGPMYESVESKSKSENNYIGNTYSNIDGDRDTSRSLVLTSETNDVVHYHEVGPDAVQSQTPNDTTVSLHAPKNAETFLGNSESVNDNSESYYEDPAVTKFRVASKTTFETTGFYVLTEEERCKYEEVKTPSVNQYNKLNFFVEDDIYWAPATTTSGLYCQLASKKYREIPRNQIRLQNPLGSGQFGEVYKATWSIHEHELELAVKTLKAGASEEDKIKFLQEAAIMGQFSHTNVIKMYGVVTLGEPILICSELLENGDLRGYLQRLNLKGSKQSDFMEVQLKFLRFSGQIAAGMDYLSKKSFVHKDLAARNVLLNKSLQCKVADFGMARDLMDDTYYTSSGGQIPVKWTAPEALIYKKYSTDSDVWSYGMVLFEIWSVARKPFSNCTNSQVIRLLKKGFCQAPPPGCPRAIYELMVDCWNPDHQSRPNFSTCQNYLKQPSSRLLYWAPEDDNLSPSVGIFGAPLQEAQRLHLDLQKKYSVFH